MIWKSVPVEGCEHTWSASAQPLPGILQFYLIVAHQWLILMREVEHPSQIGHVSIHHLKPTLPEVEEDLIALICVTTVPHFSSVFNLLCPWTWCDTGWPQWNCIQSDKFKRRIPLCIQPFVMLNWKWTPQENWVVMVKCAACKIWP